MPNAFKMVTAAPSITSKVKARKKLTPALSDPFIRKRESLQWSPLAGLWARIVLHDYCSSKEDWKIKYLTLLIFMAEVRNGYGLASQQCLPVLNSICTHILLTHVLNTTYSSSLQHTHPPLSHPITAWRRIFGWFSVCSIKSKYHNSYLTICMAKREAVS